jgi:hypothetical protein
MSARKPIALWPGRLPLIVPTTPVPPTPPGRLDAPCAQTFCYDRGGSVLFQAQFRMGVKITTDGSQFEGMRTSTFK